VLEDRASVSRLLLRIRVRRRHRPLIAWHRSQILSNSKVCLGRKNCPQSRTGTTKKFFSIVTNNNLFQSIGGKIFHAGGVRKAHKINIFLSEAQSLTFIHRPKNTNPVTPKIIYKTNVLSPKNLLSHTHIHLITHIKKTETMFDKISSWNLSFSKPQTAKYVQNYYDFFQPLLTIIKYSSVTHFLSFYDYLTTVLIPS